MSIIRDVWVRCDDCGDAAFASHTAKQARLEAGKNGWARHNGKDYCPRCAPNNSSSGRGKQRGMTLNEVKKKYFPNKSLDELEGHKQKKILVILPRR